MPPGCTVLELSIDDIESLAVGAWVLGTGGGGNPYLPLLNMRQLYKQGHRVRLMDAADLADDDLVGTVANMGAPLVGQERLTDSLTLARAVTAMETPSRQALPRADEHGDRRRQRRAAVHGGGAPQAARSSTATRWAAPIRRRR